MDNKHRRNIYFAELVWLSPDQYKINNTKELSQRSYNKIENLIDLVEKFINCKSIHALAMSLRRENKTTMEEDINGKNRMNVHAVQNTNTRG